MRNHIENWLKRLWVAAGLLSFGACADLRLGQRSDAIDENTLWSDLDVQDDGSDDIVGFISGPTDYDPSADLHTLRAHIGLADTSAWRIDQRGAVGALGTYGAFDLTEAQDIASFAAGVAITAPGARVVACEPDTTGEGDYSAAAQKLADAGAVTVAGVRDFASISTLATKLASLQANNVQIAWSMGKATSGNGFSSTAPVVPSLTDGSGNKIVFGIGMLEPQAMSGWQVFQGTVNAPALFASFAAPGTGPVQLPQSSTTSTLSTVLANRAYALGLAVGALHRSKASVHKPGDLTSGMFTDIVVGANGTLNVNGCSTADKCTAQTGTDGPSGPGMPKVSQF